MIELRQEGLNDIIKLLKKTKPKEIVEKTMEEARMKAEMYAQGYCPVDTGELIESIYTEPISNGFVLGADAKHAVFNEYGSITTPIGDVTAPLPAKKVGVRPFLRPALLRVREEMTDIFNKKLQRLVSHG